MIIINCFHPDFTSVEPEKNIEKLPRVEIERYNFFFAAFTKALQFGIVFRIESMRERNEKFAKKIKKHLSNRKEVVLSDNQGDRSTP